MDLLYFEVFSFFLLGLDVGLITISLYLLLQILVKSVCKVKDLPGPGKYSPKWSYSFLHSNPSPSTSFETHIPIPTIDGHFPLPRSCEQDYYSSSLASHFCSEPDNDSSRRYVPLPYRDIYRGCHVPGIYSPPNPVASDEGCFRGPPSLSSDDEGCFRGPASLSGDLLLTHLWNCPAQFGLLCTCRSGVISSAISTFGQPADGDAPDEKSYGNHDLVAPWILDASKKAASDLMAVRNHTFAEKASGFECRAHGNDSLLATQPNDRESIPDHAIKEFTKIQMISQAARMVAREFEIFRDHGNGKDASSDSLLATQPKDRESIPDYAFKKFMKAVTMAAREFAIFTDLGNASADGLLATQPKDRESSPDHAFEKFMKAATMAAREFEYIADKNGKDAPGDGLLATQPNDGQPIPTHVFEDFTGIRCPEPAERKDEGRS